ncbi:hypothetical protein NT6N_02330 [Oceaniferula spumae]|uniref:Ig-like domain-containing protein n=1 Tax=Oceaniferula spumae TaxID=2979115 RepID=A0AAT9FGR8_9BACT
MKRIFYPLLFLLLACALFFSVRPASETKIDGESANTHTDTRPTTTSSTQTVEPDKRSATRVLGGASQQGTLLTPEVEKQDVVIVKNDPFVKKVYSEKWIDAAEGKAGRRRVRVVEADFKYPNVRLEEEVWTDPKTGMQTVRRIRASVADHVMVGLKPGADEKAASELLEQNGYRIRAVEPGSYILAELAEFKADDAQKRSIAEIEGLNEFIDFAEPDYLVYPSIFPNDPAFANRKMWGLDNPGTVAGTTADADIDAPEAWDIRHDASGVIVAVTDTGIQYNHEDLAPNMWTNSSGHYGYDAYDDDTDPMDIGGHGTHCAGTIGARGNNGIGLTGVAWNVQLMGLRFLGPNGGSTSDGIRVVNYAKNNGAHIISASWGGGGYSQGLYNAIKAAGDAGIPFVAAAGNDSLNNDATPHYPSSYDLPTIVSVASTTSKDKLSYFSCYGRYSVDIAAPGSDIWSCYIGSNSSYKHLNGTSMATPHVSGALALARAQYPSEDAEDLIARLYSSVDHIPALAGKVATGGRLNLQKLLGASTAGVNNDDFENALRFEGSYGYWSGSNKKATREDDEDTFSIPNTGDKSVWFAWKAPYRGLVEFTVEASDKQFRVIAFKGSEKGGLTIAADGGSQSLRTDKTIFFYCEQDQEYRFLIDTSQPDGVNLLATLGLKPVNDPITGALGLSGDRFTAKGDNRNATPESFELSNPHAGVGKGKSLWWKWTPDFDGEFVITTQGSEFDTVLAVYSGTPGSLTEAASNDDRSALDWTSQVTFEVTSGTTYYIAVDGFRGDASGAILLNGFKKDALVIIKQPQDTDATIGSRSVLDVGVLGGSTVRYQWAFNGESIPGATQASLVINPVEMEDFGQYYCTISNDVSELMSNTVTLREKRTAPEIYWQSGDLALAGGADANFTIQVRGSEPLSFQWYKENVAIPGATNKTLTLNSVAAADTGNYRIEVSNDLGTASADMYLGVVTSPWEGWEWRRPGVVRAGISDIKVYGTDVYAVSGSKILYSTDGSLWEEINLPSGFTGRTMEIANGRFICLGNDNNGTYSVAISDDNTLTWSVHSLIGLTSPYSGNHLLLTIDGRFVAQLDGTGNNDVYYSNDGISWVPSQGTNLNEVTTNLKIKGRASASSSLIVAASIYTGGAGGMRHYKSTDGVNWTEYDSVPGGQSITRHPNSSAYANGKFYLFGTYSIYISSDGENWVYHNAPSNGFGSAGVFAATAEHLYSFRQDNDYYRWFSDPQTRMYRTVLPDNSHSFLSAASYGDKLIYGTDKGYISTIDDPYDVTFPAEHLSNLSGLDFVGGSFIAHPVQSFYGKRKPIVVSSDGRSWANVSLPESQSGQASTAVGYAGGKHWGHYGTASKTILTGATYGFYSEEYKNSYQGVPATINHIAEGEDGTILAVAPTSEISSSYTFYVLPNGSNTWLKQTLPFNVNFSSKPKYVDGLWFAEDSSTHKIYRSSDAITWSYVGFYLNGAQLVKKGNTIYALGRLTGYPYSTQLRKSTDGVYWSTVATSGLPTSTGNYKNLLLFNDSLVAHTGGNEVYYSNDAIAWVKSTLPEGIVGLAGGHGQLVVALEGGGILQTGNTHAGGSAPLVKITSPAPMSTHILGSNVTVTGEITDPEEGAVAYTLFLDGEEVGNSTGSSFEYTFRTTHNARHVFSVIATDSHGLSKSDSVVVNTTSAERANLLNLGEGKNYVPSNHRAQLGGVFYVAGPRDLYRSSDGYRWESIPLPSLPDSIYAMASGNGVLVIQFSNGSVISSKDGVNWVHYSPNLTDYWVRTPLRFESDRFIAAYQTQGTTSGSVMTSTDGFNWKTGEVSVEGYLQWQAIGPDGTIIGGIGYGSGMNASTDNGLSWKKISVNQTAQSYNTRGIYAGGQFVVFNNQTKKLFRSQDAVTWSTDDLPETTQQIGRIIHSGGRYFIGSSASYLFSSSDAVTWQSINSDHPVDKIIYHKGQYLGVTSNGLVMSENGETWESFAEVADFTSIASLISNGEIVMAIHSNGAVSISSDLLTWEQSIQGRGTEPLPSNKLPHQVESFNGKLILGGDSGLLLFSEDDGVSWSSCEVAGNTNIASYSVRTLTSDGTAAIALGISSNNGVMYRTTDGVNWSEITSMSQKQISDVATNGSEWLAVCNNGDVFRSVDSGQTWSEVAAPILERAKSVNWLDSKWVIVGAIEAGFNKRYHGLTLEAGDVLTDRGALNFYNSNSDIQKVLAHGKLLVWQRGEKIQYTSDGITWQESAINLGAGNHDYDVYPVSDGFIGFKGSNTAYYPVQMVKSQPDLLEWGAITNRFHNMQKADDVGGGRVFILGYGRVIEETFYDVTLSFETEPGYSLGIGEEVPLQVRVANLGQAMNDSTGWVVDAWFSTDSFYGDGNDAYIGHFSLPAMTLAEDGSMLFDISYEIPSEVIAGGNHITLKLRNTHLLQETNEANNIVISEHVIVTIPEWELNLNTTGSGQINQDITARRYPHGARVSLTASAGKGAAFAGWGGDALGAESQITILMNGDKSVQATFSSRASLQVHVRGAGSVSGLADLGSYGLNETASLTAVPADGWIFAGWSGAVTGSSATANVVMDSPKAVTAVFTLPVANWKSEHFTEAELLDELISGDDADPDQDGLKNWQEYLHMSDPRDSTSKGVLSMKVEGDYLFAIFTRNSGAQGGLSLGCQGSRDLADWDAPDIEERVLSTRDGVETVEARIPVGTVGSGFIRLKYDRP